MQQLSDKIHKDQKYLVQSLVKKTIRTIGSKPFTVFPCGVFRTSALNRAAGTRLLQAAFLP